MIKVCKHCNVELNESNASRARGNVYRRVCKLCRSKTECDRIKNNSAVRSARNIYVNEYLRKIGKVKEYPCETCTKPCYRKGGRIFCSDICRLMGYVEKTDWCWLWTGALNRAGYGKISSTARRYETSHRLSYKLFKGPIEDGKLVCHTCDVRNCVNPDHLWLGTVQDNSTDMVEKGRQASKLSSIDVFKIRQLVENKGLSQAEVKDMFGITDGHMSLIINRKVWKHV